ncbi:hypothetical protein G5B00_08880 [Parapedobacter sp. SGR-10]|uniref:hypothetical protein n=1 Tax=Parapedobacter sp. SGR-10 TaxID=2710879 RepID=UPI0013D3A8D3|nr:hypothetical protein [Parapedobacter sp. SGR-10]NGF56631.1 hypothetical protein [Parapedobacter sp. SGR-10]
MMKYFSFLFAILSLILPAVVSGQYQRINNFMIKENLTSNGKIAIIAVDSAENADESINGTFKFSINGFEQSLAFHQGVAVPSHPIDGSTFAYFKHKNQEGNVGKLYFLHKKDREITPVKINGVLLLAIPLFILLIGYVFKRFLTTFAIIAIVYGYFSYSKGLSLIQILESAYQTIKNFL